jgi:zinc protease
MFFRAFESGKSAQSEIEFEEYDLKNGLHVVLHKDNSNPLVSVDIWYHVGSKNEEPNRTGFAHLFEHMMFQGSANVRKSEHFKYLQGAGGFVNGSTSQDRTNYLETVPSNNLELVLWLESDRMGTLAVTQENFDNQKDVVKEEKRRRYDNAPYGSRFYNLFSKSFGTHPYGWIPIGSMKDLDKADLKYAQNFYKRFYAPDNAVLVIAGDIDYKQTRELTEKYFGNLEPAKSKKINFPEIAFNKGGIIEKIYDNIQLPALYTAYKIPGLHSKDIYALDLLSAVLADGKSSRLYNDIVYKNKIAKSVNSLVWNLELGGLFVISATGFPGTDLQKIQKHIDKQIEKIISSGVSSHELLKAKNKFENSFINRQQTMLGLADLLAYYWTFYNNTGMINSDLGRFLKVSAEDIKETAAKYLIKNNRVVLNYLPKNKPV